MSWALIESQTLGSSVASVTMGSGGTLPQTYKTLKIVVSARGTNTNVYDSVYFQFNNSTPNYSSTDASWRFIQGSGTSTNSVSSNNPNNGITSGSTATANTFGSMEILIPNYSGAAQKALSADSVGENNGTEAYQRMLAGLWVSVAAITSMTLFPSNAGNFVAGSSFTLYGLK